jgi:ABC-type lipoprotein export system ATPase subunit
MSLIVLREISKTYKIGEMRVPVLHGVSLGIERGELVSLMGASGSGKSTLMNILGCLDRPTGGQYWLEEVEVNRLSARRQADLRNQKIGFVFQSFNLLSRTSALDNVLLPREYRRGRRSRSQERQWAMELLERVGLKDRLHHHPSQLSGGQQQRVAIARSLVNRPSILFADEPTGNLDSRTSAEILEMFQKLNEEEGITIMLVTHDTGVASQAKRVIHIRDGMVAEDGASGSGPISQESGGESLIHAPLPGGLHS